MNRQQSLLGARGVTDDNDSLISADAPLAELQQSCGGALPGTLAVPELLDLVRQAREMGLRIAREFSAFDGEEIVSGFARIRPLDEADAGGCEVVVENWHRAPQAQLSSREAAERLDAIDRAAAELIARLDARQMVQFANVSAPDLKSVARMIEQSPGKAWSEYIELDGIAHQQPLHWRLLDGARANLPDSPRDWRVRLITIGPESAAPRGFELLLVADQPASAVTSDDEDAAPNPHSRLIGSALTPVLRQPIARIIANAETIRSRLAGPLREDYSDYAGNIAAAGQHLSGMLDDLADLEVVEAPGFTTAKERVDLVDVARRAAGILGVRAQARTITLSFGQGGAFAEGGGAPSEPVWAMAEFRRVLQILINLIGNAIAYSPEGSAVTLEMGAQDNDTVAISVIDQGPGVTQEQAAKIFEKFERLGRDSDGGNDSGSGLGLYISRRLAVAMDGDLEVLRPSSSEALCGAEFKLTLPAV